MSYKFTDSRNMVGKRPRQTYFTEIHEAIKDLDQRTSSSSVNVIEVRGARDPITLYPRGITVFQVSETVSSGYPTLTGTVETIYVDENRNVQYFFTESRDVNTMGSTYVRQWSNSGVIATWTSWSKIVTEADIEVSSGAKTYTHTQLSPSTTWVINHSLERFPSVSIVDSAGTVVVGDVTYNTSNTITVTFSSPFAGKAYLN